MGILKNLFSSAKCEGINLEITKYVVNDMKDSDQKNQDKIDRDLQKVPEIVDRRVLMSYEKKFMHRFKKIGDLNQKCPYCAKNYKRLSLGEKKCLQCDKTFFVQKRVQDLATVTYRDENKKQFDAQWKAISKLKKFKFYLAREYEYLEQALKKEGKLNIQKVDVMHCVLDAYAKNALNSGYYELYTAFIFHKAELMRSEQRFAEALQYYFYVHFLQSNGVDNEANFILQTQMNPELRERLVDLLNLGKIQVKHSQELFEYAIKHLGAFSSARVSVNTHKSFSMLMKEFKEEDGAKDEHKPMRSFVLYTKAS